MCGVIGSSGVVGIACGCGRNLMLTAFQLAHMSCTQRQRGGAAERGEAHVGGRGAVGWSSVVGIVSGSGWERGGREEGKGGAAPLSLSYSD